VIFNRLFSNIGNAYLLLSGISLILTAIFNPIGIAGAVRQNIATLIARRRGLASGIARGAPETPAVHPVRAPAARVAGSAGILATEELSVAYGGLLALDHVSLRVPPGQIVGLIGPNGAGKTTCIDAMTGFADHAGTISIGEHRLDQLVPHQRARLGLARTWQAVELFNDLTVRDNLRVGADRAGLRAIGRDVFRPGRQTDAADVDWALDLLGLRAHADEKPSALPLGQQKLLGVARALATRPSVVLLDEPAAGLDTNESQALGERLRDIVDHGISVLLVDHDMGLVLDVCDYLYVLEFGQLIAQGAPEAVRADRRVIEAYLGQSSRPAATSIAVAPESSGQPA